MATKSKKSKKSKKSELNGLYTAGFVLGIVGIVFAFIPFCYYIAYILGGLALIFGIIGLVKKEGEYKSLTATILGAATIIVGIVMHVVAIQTVNTVVGTLDSWTNEVNQAFDDVLSDYESDIVGKYAEVEVLGYQEVDDVWDDHAIVVRVKNISDETRSFSISLEAIGADGDRLDTSSFYAENLAPGQSQTFNTFTLTTLDDDQLENATIKVYQSSTY